MDREPVGARLARLRKERGLSQPTLYRKVDGVSFETIKAIESGRRYPSADVLVKLSEALDVAPDEFPEYRLAVARQALDEREVGLEQALLVLSQLEGALGQQAQAAAGRAAPRASETNRRKSAGRGGTRKQAGG